MSSGMFTGCEVILFLGPPGSGKGTQASRVGSALDIPAISTGEMLRRECNSGSALGKAVQDILDAGQLVSDDLINQVVASRLAQGDCRTGCILDGYPRTVAQARYLGALLNKLNMGGPVAFHFEISLEEVVGRLENRKRADDQPATIRERLRVYNENAVELIRYYRTRDYYRIAANRTPEEVCDELLSVLGRRWSTAAVSAQRNVSAQPSFTRIPALS
ncbi:MAG: nucleoside monophosphate kinase [Bryobacteraceae bacterium]